MSKCVRMFVGICRMLPVSVSSGGRSPAGQRRRRYLRLARRVPRRARFWGSARSAWDVRMGRIPTGTGAANTRKPWTANVSRWMRHSSRELRPLPRPNLLESRRFAASRETRATSNATVRRELTATVVPKEAVVEAAEATNPTTAPKRYPTHPIPTALRRSKMQLTMPCGVCWTPTAVKSRAIKTQSESNSAPSSKKVSWPNTIAKPTT